MALRLTGTVHKINHRSGEKIVQNPDGTRTVSPWEMETFSILTEEDIQECSFPRSWDGPKPQKGDLVDFNVRAYARNDRLNVTVISAVTSDPLSELLNA